MSKTLASILSVLFLCTSLFAIADVRDPTTPLGHMPGGAAGASEQQFVLNSVLISSQRKLAIINGSTLREGQLIPGTDNVKVQRISAQTVVLQQAERTWVLRLSPSIVRKH